MVRHAGVSAENENSVDTLEMLRNDFSETSKLFVDDLELCDMMILVIR